MARAISGVLFFGSLTIGACSPDLSREDGSLRIAVTDIAAEAQSVRLRVQVPRVEAEESIELPALGSEIEHHIQSLPAGIVQVEAYAEVGAEVIAHGVGAVVVSPGAEGAVRIQLGSVDSPPLVSSTSFEVDLGPLTPGRGSPLQAEGSVPQEPWTAFQALVAAHLGTPAQYRLATARVDLVPGLDGEIEKLQDLWRGTVALQFVKGSEVVTAGELVLGEDSPSGVFSETSARLDSVLDPDLLNLTVRIVGSPMFAAEDDHVASVRVSFRLVATK